MGRDILINFQLKKFFLWAATRKNETKLRKTEKPFESELLSLIDYQGSAAATPSGRDNKSGW